MRRRTASSCFGSKLVASELEQRDIPMAVARDPIGKAILAAMGRALARESSTQALRDISDVVRDYKRGDFDQRTLFKKLERW
jgi:hypothetical protein